MDDWCQGWWDSPERIRLLLLNERDTPPMAAAFETNWAKMAL